MTDERRETSWAAVRQFFGRVPLWVWTLVCLGIAAFYVVVWPSEPAPAEMTDFRYIALRWLHPLAWLFLALSCVVRMIPGKTRLANRIAFLSLPSYLLFFLANLSSV